MSAKELIGAREAAKILGLSVPGLHKRVTDGRLEVLATVGKRGTRVFDRAAIEALASEEAKA